MRKNSGFVEKVAFGQLGMVYPSQTIDGMNNGALAHWGRRLMGAHGYNHTGISRLRWIVILGAVAWLGAICTPHPNPDLQA